MANTRIIEPNFPNLLIHPDGGISEIQTGSSDFKIDAFEQLMLNTQPIFFITKANWQKLFDGKGANGRSWLPKGYEVFGFVFCIAFTEEDFKAGRIPRAYFRIRTVIKQILIDSREATIPAEIETTNIAYVDINSLEDSVKFINHRSEKYQYVNRGVRTFKEQLAQHNALKIFAGKQWTQEGCIFGKNSPYLLKNIFDKNVKVKGTTVAIGWNVDKNDGHPSFTFILKTNPDGEIDGIKCPVPHTACFTD